MNAKVKECFTPHIMMHSAFGLGLGIVLATLLPQVRMLWIGFLLMALAVIADAKRKTA